MALIHQFAVIAKDSNSSIISSSMNSVSISDIVIQYIGDSLNWIYTTWNGKVRKNGISYYGFSIIEGNEIEKFEFIVKQWRELFCLSPEEFYLTGNFLLDENRYEKNQIKRDELLKELDSCIAICERAIIEKAKILHNGI